MLTDALPAAALAVSPTTRTARAPGADPTRRRCGARWRSAASDNGRRGDRGVAAGRLHAVDRDARRPSRWWRWCRTQLGQTLIDSHSPLVVATAVGSLVALGGGDQHARASASCSAVRRWGRSAGRRRLATAGVATAAAAMAPHPRVRPGSVVDLDDAAAPEHARTTPATVSQRSGRRRSTDPSNADTEWGHAVHGEPVERPNVENAMTGRQRMAENSRTHGQSPRRRGTRP